MKLSYAANNLLSNMVSIFVRVGYTSNKNGKYIAILNAEWVTKSFLFKMGYFFVDYCYTVIESETLFVLKYDEYTYDDRRYEICLRLENCCASIAFEYAKIIIVFVQIQRSSMLIEIYRITI